MGPKKIVCVESFSDDPDILQRSMDTVVTLGQLGTYPDLIVNLPASDRGFAYREAAGARKVVERGVYIDIDAQTTDELVHEPTQRQLGIAASGNYVYLNALHNSFNRPFLDGATAMSSIIHTVRPEFVADQEYQELALLKTSVLLSRTEYLMEMNKDPRGLVRGNTRLNTVLSFEDQGGVAFQKDCKPIEFEFPRDKDIKDNQTVYTTSLLYGLKNGWQLDKTLVFAKQLAQVDRIIEDGSRFLSAVPVMRLSNKFSGPANSRWYLKLV